MTTALKRLLAVLGLSLLVGLAIPTALHAAQTITYYHLDALGSPVAATDVDGNVKWREQYRPYGDRLVNEPAAQTSSRWFTGHPHDQEFGLTYAGARWYDPVVGRFLGVDPKGFTEGNPQSFNRYAYGNNNPYRYVDPDGNVPVDTFVDAGFVIYDFGQFLGAGAAYTVGAITGNEALQAEGLAGLQDTGTALGGSLTGLAIPYAPAAVTRGVAKGVTKGTAGGTRAGKSFTPKGKAEIDAANAERHGGANVCENCGTQVISGQRSQRGVTPPGNERQRDHIIPKSKGGDGDPSNGQILCRTCNLDKSDKL